MEIAGIVVFAFFGVLSQFRIWKVVQARKAKKQEAKRLADIERDMLEAELGRKVEQGNARDRSQWEAMYSEKDQVEDDLPPDSGVGTEASSTRKTSMCVEEGKMKERTTVARVEMDGSPSPTYPLQVLVGPVPKHGIVVQVGDDDLRSQADSAFQPKALSVVVEDARKSPVPSQNGSRRNSGSKATLLTPTSAKFPRHGDASSTKAADARSMASQPSPTESTFSLAALRGSDNKRASFISRASMEALVDPNMLEDFLASTSQAGEHASYAASQAPRPNATNSAKNVESAHSANSSKLDTPNLEQGSFVHGSQLSPNLGSLADDAAIEKGPSTREVTSVLHDDSGSQPAENLPPVVEDSPSMRSIDKESERAQTQPSFQTLGEEEAHPIVQQYRTNEWAKHLAQAETPELDPLRPVDRHERASIVDAEALLQTALTAEPEPIELADAKSAEVSPPSALPMSPTRPQAMGTATPPPASLVAAAEPVMQYTPGGRAIPGRVPSITYNGASLTSSTGSGGSVVSPRSRPVSSTRRVTSGMRSASALAHTPISEHEEMSFHTPRASPLPMGTLLAERNSMLAHKSLTGQLPTPR